MSCWFKKNLGDAMLAWAELDQIETLFLSMYGKGSCHDKEAVFIRHESEGHLHCEVNVYLSPSLALMAEKMGADPCNRPSSDGLSLLVGGVASEALYKNL